MLDGTNLALLHGKANPELRYVLALCHYFEQQSFEFDCFFDANTRYIFEDFRPEQLAALDQITSQMPWSMRFHVVPSGTQADQWILEQAKSDGACVISNDKFRDRARKNPWIWKRRHSAQIIDSCLTIPGLNLVIAVLAKAEDYLGGASAPA